MKHVIPKDSTPAPPKDTKKILTKKMSEFDAVEANQEELKNANNSFKATIEQALKEIENEDFVKQILKSKPLNKWKDLIIRNGGESAFEDGDEINGRLSISMNTEQCANMKFNDVQQNVESVLLHELGHAYQFYLSERNKDNKKEDYHDYYPLFSEAIDNQSEELFERIRISLSYFDGFKDQIESVIKKLKEKDVETIKSIIDLMQNIGEGAAKKTYDGDNIFMNEIPYNHKKGLGIRTQYKGSLTYTPDADLLSAFNKIIRTVNSITDFFEGEKYEKEVVENRDNRKILTETLKESPAFLDYLHRDFWIHYLKSISEDEDKDVLDVIFAARHRAKLNDLLKAIN